MSNNTNKSKNKWLSPLTVITTVVSSAFIIAIPVFTMTSFAPSKPITPPEDNNQDNSQDKIKQVKIRNSVGLVGSIDDLLTDDHNLKPIEQIWETYLNKNKIKIIENYNDFSYEQIADMEITVKKTKEQTAQDKWGGIDPYDTWGKANGIQTIHYKSPDQISVSSTKELKNSISKYLKDNNLNYTIVDSSMLGIDKKSHDYLQINLQDNNSKKTLLSLPVSDINYNSMLEVSIEATDPNIIVPKPKVVGFNYDIGIDDKVELRDGVKTDNNVVEKDGILPVGNVLMSLSIADADNSNNIIINQEKTSWITNVYNVKWEQPTQSDLNYTDDNKNNDTLTLRATPHAGHYWQDTGTSETRVIPISGLNVHKDTSNSKK